MERKSKLAIVQTILLAAILAIMIVIGVIGITGFNSVQKNLNIIEKDLQQLDMDEVNDTIAALNEAANTLGQVDMDSLNKLISSLSSTAETLQTASDLLGGLFGR